MPRWIDVNEDDWFFSEVMEASNIILEDGDPFISGIPYNAFFSDAPYLYEEQKVTATGKKKFTLTKKITPTPANPLYVFIDGTQTLYKSATANAGGTTDVELFSPVRVGAIVSFNIVGKPELDRFGKPRNNGGDLPNHKLDHGDAYYYNPFSRQNIEYLYAFGRPLRRLTVPDQEWQDNPNMDVAKKYIGLKTDVYVVSPAEQGGYLYIPYNLNGVTCNFTYNSMDEDGTIHRRGGNFKVTVGNPVYNNRFFPNAYISRAEAFMLIDRLRRTFYSRFTDKDAPTNEWTQEFITYEGQVAFKLDYHYDIGKDLKIAIYTSPTSVGYPTRDVEYTEVSSNSVVWKYPLPAGRRVVFSYKKTMSSRFYDVGRVSNYYNITTQETDTVDGSLLDDGVHKPSWWALPVIAMENEQLNNGEYLIYGIEVDNFNEYYVHAAVVDNMNNPIGSGLPEAPKEIWFMPETLLSRAQAVTFLNRFIKWSVERFK